jgi:hypothetical protein
MLAVDVCLGSGGSRNDNIFLRAERDSRDAAGAEVDDGDVGTPSHLAT